jgi:phosphoenolpyruvate-protein kinase (PTS system EI component)
MNDAVRTVQLPSELCASAEKKFGSRFADIEDLLRYVLGELLRDDEMRLSQVEQEIVEKRLRDLGYV